MEQTDNTDGRRWAHAGLIGTLLVSVGANVAHVVLADSALSVWLRLPNGVFWPVVTFVAIEVVVRMVWPGRWMDILARVIMFGSMIPTVFVSYGHQYHLLGLMGESAFLQIIGPIGIDGFMIGFTMTLLATSARIVDRAPAVEAVAEAIIEAEEATQELPAIAPEPEAKIERAPRVRPAEGRLNIAVKALMDGANSAEAASLAGMSVQAVRRYARIVRELRANPHGQLPPAALKSVNGDVVTDIRAWAIAR